MNKFLIWLNNLLVPASERYVEPVKLYKFTFHMVGVDKHVTVIDKNRDDAARAAYDRISDTDLEKLEWADLIKKEPVIASLAIQESKDRV